MTPGVLAQATRKIKLPLSEAEKAVGGVVWEVGGVCFGNIKLQCLWVIQVEVLSWQLDIQLMTEVQARNIILRIVTVFRWYLKTWEWVRSQAASLDKEKRSRDWAWSLPTRSLGGENNTTEDTGNEQPWLGGESGRKRHPGTKQRKHFKEKATNYEKGC